MDWEKQAMKLGGQGGRKGEGTPLGSSSRDHHRALLFVRTALMPFHYQIHGCLLIAFFFLFTHYAFHTLDGLWHSHHSISSDHHLAPQLSHPRNAAFTFSNLFTGVGEKIGFYFAVQSGGEFEIDYEVLDPEERVVLKGEKERQGDYIFTANKVRAFRMRFPLSPFFEILGLRGQVLDLDCHVLSPCRLYRSALERGELKKEV